MPAVRFGAAHPTNCAAKLGRPMGRKIKVISAADGDAWLALLNPHHHMSDKDRARERQPALTKFLNCLRTAIDSQRKADCRPERNGKRARRSSKRGDGLRLQHDDVTIPDRSDLRRRWGRLMDAVAQVSRTRGSLSTGMNS